MASSNCYGSASSCLLNPQDLHVLMAEMRLSVTARVVFLRSARMGVVVLLVGIIHSQARWSEAKHRLPISLRQALRFFPLAHRVQLKDPERGTYLVSDAKGTPVGTLLRTSPFTDRIVGYAGPNDVLIALDEKGAVRGLEILRSGDTPEHVRQVREAPGFLRRFLGWSPSSSLPPRVDGVAGATLTSLAVAESIAHRLEGASPPPYASLIRCGCPKFKVYSPMLPASSKRDRGGVFWMIVRKP